MSTLITNPGSASVNLPAGFFAEDIGPHEGLVVSDGQAEVDAQIAGLGLSTETLHSGGSTGWVDDGTVVRLTDTSDNVSMGDAVLGAKLRVVQGVNTAPALDVLSAGSTTSNVIQAQADNLTAGSLLSLSSNSADVSARNLVEITNDNALAIAAVTLHLQQDSNATALSIDHNGESGTAISIPLPNSSTSDIISVANANSLTTASIMSLSSNSPDASVRNLVEIVNDNAAAAATQCLFLRQDAGHNAMQVAMNGDGSAFDVIPIGSINENVIDLTGANSLVLGSIIAISSASTSISSRSLIDISNQGIGSDATRCIDIEQLSAGDAILINNSGNGRSINIVDPDATTSDIFVVSTANDLTTGSMMSLSSNSASTSARNLVEIINDNTAADSAQCLFLRQDSDGDVIFIDSNGNNESLHVDTPATTTRNVLQVANANSLTTGGILFLTSNSASASPRNLALIANSNALADSATCLALEQTSDAPALSIDHNGNGRAIVVLGSPATTSTVIDVSGIDSLTTGGIINFNSNSASTSARNLVTITNDNIAADSAACLHLQQDSDAAAISIDMNGNGRSIDIPSSANTTADVINVFDFALTTGALMRLTSNSGSTSVRTLAEISNGNSLADNAICLTIRQDADADGLHIVSVANGTAINIPNPDATTSDLISVTTANDLTTGSIMSLDSNSASTSARNLVEITNDNAAADSAKCLFLQQDSDAAALDIDYNGDGPSIRIDSPSNVNSSVFEITNVNSMNGGNVFRIVDDSGSGSSRSLVSVTQDSAAASFTTVMSLTQDANFVTLNIAQNGNGRAIDINPSGVLTENVIDLTGANALTLGSCIGVSSASTSTSSRALVNIDNQSTSATSAQCLRLRQNADTAFTDYAGPTGATTSDPISTLTTSGAVQGHIQIEINGVKRWIAFLADPS